MKALGLTAMIIAIIAIFIPVAGPYLTLLCALLAAFGAGPGLTFAAVAILINVINISILSPSLWLVAGMAEAEQAGAGGNVLAGMGVVFIGAQVVAIVILSVIHIMWKRRQASAA